MPRTFTKKNGEITIYDSSKYNKISYEKNKEALSIKNILCPYCNINYAKINASNHRKGKKHLAIIAFSEKAKQSEPELS